MITNFYIDFENKRFFKYSGYIIKIIDGVAWVDGLFGAGLGELVYLRDFKQNIAAKGLILTLDETLTGVLLFGGEEDILPGFSVLTTGKLPQVKVGPGLLGTVLDPLTNRLDSNKKLKNFSEVDLASTQIGIIERQSVHQSLLTGIKAIDSMIPIGRGQRELIIGDRQTGKTTIALDTILNQSLNYDYFNNKKLPWWADRSKFNVSDKVFSIYVGIGQKKSTVKQIHQLLKEFNAVNNTIIILAAASEPASLQYLAPYTGCTIAEWFMFHGLHSLIIYDDLSKHAVAYRQMSLLLRRSPGREAYPGDVFFLHSRLLERAAKLNNFFGGGSLTALPIIETQLGDVSAYIPTNVISITDGQIFLEFDLFKKGVRPAINVGLSVSRVGSAAQSKRMKKLAGSLKLDLAQYREVEVFSKFSSNLDQATKQTLKKGERLVEILKQDKHKPLELGLQILILYSALNGFIDNLKLNQISFFEDFIINTCRRFRIYTSLVYILEDKYYFPNLDENKILSQLLSQLLSQFLKIIK